MSTCLRQPFLPGFTNIVALARGDGVDLASNVLWLPENCHVKNRAVPSG
jgi:hypothetical protein